MIVLCKKLGLDFENAKVIDSCDESFDVEGFTIFTCPALYHKVKDVVTDYRVLGLRVLKAFENSNKVAKALLSAEEVEVEYVYDVVEVGKDVVYVGDNLDIINDLSLHCNLTVITENEDVIERLYPYEVKVIKGVVKKIEGSIGNFNIYVDGYDLVRGSKIEVIKSGQIIYPKFDGDVEGIYKDECYGAFKVLSNLGGFMKLVTVKINPDVCGVFKSGLIGCDYCLQCPTGSLKLKNGKVVVDYATCIGCGYCSSICFTSAIENKLLPQDKLIEKIDRVTSVTDCKVLAFVCEKSLGSLRRFKDLPDVAPILVPCINSVSEVHYLYAVLKGFRVLAVRCNCQNLRTECFDIAKKTLKAFGFDCLEMRDWANFKDVFEMLSVRDVPNVDFKLEGKNFLFKKENLVESLMVYELKERKFDSKFFGKIKVGESCTLCNTCINFCPMNAIRKRMVN